MLRSSVAAYAPDSSISGWDTPSGMLPTAGDYEPDFAEIIGGILDPHRTDAERLRLAGHIPDFVQPSPLLPTGAPEWLDLVSRLHRKGWLGARDGRAYLARPSRPLLRLVGDAE